MLQIHTFTISLQWFLSRETCHQKPYLKQNKWSDDVPEKHGSQPQTGGVCARTTAVSNRQEPVRTWLAAGFSFAKEQVWHDIPQKHSLECQGSIHSTAAVPPRRQQPQRSWSLHSLRNTWQGAQLSAGYGPPHVPCHQDFRSISLSRRVKRRRCRYSYRVNKVSVFSQWCSIQMVQPYRTEFTLRWHAKCGKKAPRSHLRCWNGPRGHTSSQETIKCEPNLDSPRCRVSFAPASLSWALPPEWPSPRLQPAQYTRLPRLGPGCARLTSRHRVGPRWPVWGQKGPLKAYLPCSHTSVSGSSSLFNK